MIYTAIIGFLAIFSIVAIIVAIDEIKFLQVLVALSIWITISYYFGRFLLTLF